MNGTKLCTVHKAGNTTTTTDYCGNVIYENGVQELLLTDAGHVTLSDKKYHYYLQDHQENNRVVVDQTGQKEEVGHYYHIMIRRDKTALIGTSGREDSVFAVNRVN